MVDLGTGKSVASVASSEMEQGACSLPATIARAGDKAEKRFLEFFTANIRNPNTRRAYLRAILHFFDWCERYGWALAAIEPAGVAAYTEKPMQERATPTVKQHLAVTRMLFDYLVVGQIVPFNPAATVRGPKHVVKKGGTPVLFEEDPRLLIDSIHIHTLIGLRDRAILGVMTYSFAHVGAVVKMRVKDYFIQNRKAWFILHEKSGKFHRVPAHHKAADYLEAYLSTAAIAEDRNTPLFRSVGERGRSLSERGLNEVDILRMIKRRALAPGLPSEICCHTFRATGITNYLQNGGDIETAAKIAAHESTRTTQLYNRGSDEVELGEIERIRI